MRLHGGGGLIQHDWSLTRTRAQDPDNTDEEQPRKDTGGRWLTASQ